MTDRETLKEKVARLYIDKWGLSDYWLADAAIDLVMEEAAEAVAYLRWQEVDPFDGRTLGAAVNALRAYIKSNDNE